MCKEPLKWCSLLSEDLERRCEERHAESYTQGKRRLMTGRSVGRSVVLVGWSVGCLVLLLLLPLVGRLVGLASAVTRKRPPRFATNAELCRELSS